MQDSEMCKHKRVYLQHQVRFVHIYSECGERVPGVQREGPGLGEKLTHTPLQSVCDNENTQSERKGEVSTTIQRGPTLHRGLKYCLE